MKNTAELWQRQQNPWQGDQVQRHLDSRWLTPVLLKETGSTNDDIALFARKHRLSAGSWALIASQHQRAGRGRRGRVWQTDPGDALLFSIATRLQLPAERWPCASLIVGHAVLEVLTDLLPQTNSPKLLGLRWPNDVLIGPQHLKLAGILCERIEQPGHFSHGSARSEGALWIAGVGLNLQTPTADALAPHTAGLHTWLSPQQQRIFNVETLLGQLADRIQHHMDAWQLRGGFVIPELHGQSLRFTDVEVGVDRGDGQRIAMWLDGLDRTGALCMRDVVDGRPVGLARAISPLRLLDAATTPPWHHPADPTLHP